MNWIAALGNVERYPLLDTLAKEVIGINAPRIALTRSPSERMDVAVSGIGNMLSFAVGGTLADKAFQKIFESAQKPNATIVSKQWATLGRSLGMYSTIFSLMWGMPFIRNYITAKRTGKTNFSDVIQTGTNTPATPQPAQNSALQKALKSYRNTALTVLGLGAAGAIGSVGLTRAAASAGKDFGKAFLKKVFNGPVGKHLLMEKGQFSKMGTWPTLLFWGAPSYLGWIHASRDQYEKKEQALKFANFIGCFFGPSLILNQGFNRYFATKFPKIPLNYESITKALAHQPQAQKQALTIWATKNLASLGSSIVLLGTVPQLMNIYLTKKRMQRDMAHQKQAPADKKPVLSALNQPPADKKPVLSALNQPPPWPKAVTSTPQQQQKPVQSTPAALPFQAKQPLRPAIPASPWSPITF